MLLYGRAILHCTTTVVYVLNCYYTAVVVGVLTMANVPSKDACASNHPSMHKVKIQSSCLAFVLFADKSGEYHNVLTLTHTARLVVQRDAKPTQQK